MPPEEPEEPSEVAEDVDGDAFDPFRGHLAFAAGRGATVRAWHDKTRIRFLDPLASRVEELVDFDVLEAFKTPQVGFKAPRVKAKEEFDGKLEDWMQEMEPQFILRNLGRYEKFADPDLPLGLETSAVPVGMTGDELDAVRKVHHEPPELLDETSLMRFAENRGDFKTLYDVMQWEHHFSKEIKEDHVGPMWTYDPLAAQKARRKAAEEQAAIEGRTADELLSEGAADDGDA